MSFLPRLGFCVSSLLLLLASCAFASAAKADTYTYVELASSSGSISNRGITNGGTVEISSSTLGYNTYSQAAGFSGWTDTAPQLTFDNGSTCNAVNTGVFEFISDMTCNNGHLAFFGMTATSRGLYSGFDLAKDLIYGSNAGNISLNASGDLLFTAFLARGDINTVAYNVTSSSAQVTPEPSSLLLLATGGLSVSGIVRRRLLRVR